MAPFRAYLQERKASGGVASLFALSFTGGEYTLCFSGFIALIAACWAQY